MQARSLHASHMTFNKFQTLFAFQSAITAGRRLEHRNFDLNYQS